MPRLGLGWKPDTPDIRDRSYRAERKVDVAALPSQVDLRSEMKSQPWNQLTLGSCTGQSTAVMVEFVRGRQGLPYIKPSPMFLYYNARLIEGTVTIDNGAELRSTLKVVARKGVCSEEDCPYLIERFTERPSSKAYSEALQYRAIEYGRVQQQLEQMKGCLVEGFPFVFGFGVYSSFDEVDSRGFAQIPEPGEVLEGGHAVIACGYSDTRYNGSFTVRNSWDVDWGDGGYFYLPYSYLTNPELSQDLWTIRLGT